MRIKLKFHITDFKYLAPIIVQKSTFIKNRLLSIAIYQNEINEQSFISTLDLTVLAHFHHYQLEEWRFVLDSFFEIHEIHIEDINFKKPFFNMIYSPPHFTGELLFIIESVLFSFIENKHPELLNFVFKKPIEINALFSPDLPLKRLPSWIKIKINPTSSCLESTITLINDLRAQKEHLTIRLDGNAQFELTQLLSFLNALEKKCGPIRSFIDYIEEPFFNYHDYYLFQKLSLIPYALDESLLFFQDSLDQLPKKCFLILKPSLMGISKGFELIDRNPHKVIVSSTYETATAIRPLLYLAALNPLTAHGLDTPKFLPKHLGIDVDHFSLSF